MKKIEFFRLFKSLHRQAKEKNIKVTINNKFENSGFMPSRYSNGEYTFEIQLKTNENNLKRIANFAHELGHFEHFLATKETYSWGSSIEYFNRVTIQGKEPSYDLLNEEKLAWENGDKILKNLGFNIKQKKYIDHKIECLNNYKEFIDLCVRLRKIFLEKKRRASWQSK